MEKMFQRNIENFHCEKCGREVEGNGYTNHCPECLTSKHVDINPGDRASTCGGMMDAVGFDQKNGEFRIKHLCSNCGFVRMNKVSPEDNFEELIKLSKRIDDK
jgi:hypothetical protein